MEQSNQFVRCARLFAAFLKSMLDLVANVLPYSEASAFTMSDPALNRPISAYFQSVLSFPTSEMILESLLERRLKEWCMVFCGSVRRNISRTCWVASKESRTPFRPLRAEAATAFGCGARCRGCERAR